MRRKDREVLNEGETFKILNPCNTVRIAMHAEQ